MTDDQLAIYQLLVSHYHGTRRQVRLSDSGGTFRLEDTRIKLHDHVTSYLVTSLVIVDCPLDAAAWRAVSKVLPSEPRHDHHLLHTIGP